MDIHRCRFVPYPPAVINALAFSHESPSPQQKAPTTLRLAVGRDNGSIEIWDPRSGAWVQETVLRTGHGRSVEGMVWTHDLPSEVESDEVNKKQLPGKLRLFSIGYSSVITEWDLAAGKPVRESSGSHGAVWCLAAQPRWIEGREKREGKKQGGREQLLAAGCEDGSIVLYSTDDQDLQYARMLPRTAQNKARVLSLCFLDRNRLAAGFSDSSIRVYDINDRGRVLATMSLSTTGQKKGGSRQDILVWSIKALRGGMIVSGDSTGEVRFWDTKTWTLRQRLRVHHADVLDLAVSADGTTVLSGGMDRRTVELQRAPTGKSASGGGGFARFSEVMHKRVHKGDVKAMAAFDSATLRVAVSGGLDATPVVLPLGGLGQENSRALPSFALRPPVQSAPRKRLLMSWWDREVNIWKIGRLGQENGAVENLPREQVAKILLKGDEYLTDASLAADGSLLAVSTSTNTKVFQLSPRPSDKGYKIAKLDLPLSLSDYGARSLHISPDSKWLLVVRLDSSLKVFRFTETQNSKPSVEVYKTPADLPKRQMSYRRSKAMSGHHGDYVKTIVRAAWSSDSRMIATCDLSGFFNVWMLEGHEILDGPDEDEASSSESDSESEEAQKEIRGSKIVLGQRWIQTADRVPKLPAMALVLSFRPEESLEETDEIAPRPTRHNPNPHSHDLPKGEDRLLAVTSQNQIFEYHARSGSLSKWSRRNPSSVLPQEFQSVRDRTMGCIWDLSGSNERIWLYGNAWLWMIDLSQDLPPVSAELGSQKDQSEASKKRKRLSEEENLERRKELMRNTSGAGSRVPAHLRVDGFGRSEFEASLNRKAQEKQPKGVAADSDDDESGADELEEDSAGQLVALRRSGKESQKLINGHSNDQDTDGDEIMDGDEDAIKHYWRTYRYRPILGIAPLAPLAESHEDANGDSMALVLRDEAQERVNIEVALVERPLWDADLEPRWEGLQEWKR